MGAKGAPVPPNIEYVDMPESIRDTYQYFTQADTRNLGRGRLHRRLRDPRGWSETLRAPVSRTSLAYSGKASVIPPIPVTTTKSDPFCRALISLACVRDDAVAVVRWLLETPTVSGIFNVGTGKARSFDDRDRRRRQCGAQ